MTDILTNRYTIAYGSALLLHLLFLLLFATIRSTGLVPAPRPQPVAAEPIQFEFVDTPESPAQDKPPDDTRFVSARDAVARDASEADLAPSDAPFSEGLVETRDAYRTRPQVRPAPGLEGDRGREAAQDPPKTDFAAMLRRAGEEGEPGTEGAFGSPAIPPSLQMKNLTSRALERGGLELSTYEWEFAPYLAYLKERIGGNLFPPALFKHYGLIDGQSRLRFRIYRDGSLEGPMVLAYTGSPLLRETSVRAVELSAAFRPLPAEFPDEYLEVTGLFDYVIIRSER